MLHVREGGGSQGENRGPHGRVRDDLDAEDVGEAGAAVLAVGAEDQVLALLIEDQDAGDHGELEEEGVPRGALDLVVFPSNASRVWAMNILISRDMNIIERSGG